MIDKYRDLPRNDQTLLYSEDLQGRAVNLIIEDMNYEKFEWNEEPVLTLRFKGKKKRFPLCKTNQRLFWGLFPKEDDVKKPIGQLITLQSSKVQAFGDIVDAIRIKGAPWLPADIKISIPQGKNKVKMKLLKTQAGAAPVDPETPPAPPTPPVDATATE